MKLNQTFIDEAKLELKETETVLNRGVRDPVFTPYVLALKKAGFKIVTRKSGCMELAECIVCRCNMSAVVSKNGLVYKACPWCNQIETYRK